MEAEGLEQIVLQQVPGAYKPEAFAHEQLLREQSIGEARGLRRLDNIVELQIQELREKLKETEK